MKKGAKVFGLIVILLIIGSAFVGVVSAEEISIDTEIDESSFTVYPSRPAEGWFYVHDHDTFHTRAYDGNFWYTLCGEEGHEYPLYYGLWQASLPQSGDYEVFVWIPDPDPFVEVWPPHRTYTPTQSAVYQIYHKAGRTTKTVNQELRTGGFYSLGTFNFDTLASVILNDRTGELYLSTMIAFDAVKFVPVAAPNNPPYTPSNPSPANHATGQSIHTDLDWTSGDPDAGDTVTYDVYFGTSTSPQKVSTAQSRTTYDPALTYNKEYYWKIEATDNHGTPTTGPLWNFTTCSVAVHNMAVTNVNTEPASPYVEQSTTIYVTVKNEGSQQENYVPVKAYVDGIRVGSTQHVTLQADESETKSFSWTPSTAKAYSVKGEVGVVSGETETSDNRKTINVVVSTQPVCIPKLSIPLYAPAYQQAHNDTELTYIIRVTNEGDAKGTIDLSVSSQSISESEEKWWDTQLLPPSVTLDPKKSEDIFLNVRIKSDRNNGITIKGISNGDGSKSATCKIAAHGRSGISLFGIKLMFNEDPEEHTLKIGPQYNAKASNKQVVLSKSEKRRVSLAFDPKRSDDLKSAYNIDIKVKDTTMGGTIPIKFKEYDEIIASGFDVSEDGYRFPNWETLKWAHCYGMSETSILYFIQKKEPCTYSLTKDKARWRIWAHQIRWSNVYTLDNVKYSDIDKEEMANDYKKIEESISNKKPIILFLIKSSEEKHAVVAYKIIKEGDKSYILIYENGEPYCVCEEETPYEICKDTSCHFGYLEAYPYATFNFGEGIFSYGDYTKFKAVEAKELKRTEQVLSMMCPINTTITDQYGQIISDDGTNEIPSADMLLKNETKMFYLPTNLTYSAEIDAYDIGLFNFTKVSPVGTNISITVFENISVTASTKAFVEIEPNVTNYTMKIDYNGDGHIDEERYPDVTETIEINQPPIASFTYSLPHPIVNQTITFNASASYDPDGNITNYKWNFDNGNITDTTEPIITHSYASAGDYTVNLIVTDDDGEYSYTESSITIKEPIKEPVFYVPDDYPSIQAAVDAASAGDTIIVRDGTYTENVDIDKSITLKSSSGNPGNTIAQAANPNDHVFEITADYVNIRGFSVGGVAECCKAVIFLNEVNYCNISNNHLLNYTGISDEGILLDSSNSNTVFNNTFSGYNLYSLGIRLMNSTNNLISDNTICNCPHGGIELGFASSNNIILNNTFKSCGLCVWRYEKNTVKGNTVNDKPLIYLENVSQIEVNNAGQVILANCEHIKVIGCNLSNATIGIDLLNSSNCVIENNICRDNFCGGIDLFDYSSNNIVLNNIIENNFWGIFLTSYASNNTIVNVTTHPPYKFIADKTLYYPTQ